MIKVERIYQIAVPVTTSIGFRECGGDVHVWYLVSVDGM